ncbi:MAG: porin [Rhizobiaceae bacterium]|nr:porin [Rhizobiaceae bacterium]
MNIKSLLLGSAAALVAVTGARAADAVVVIPEPEPVEYVRVCDVYGTGYFYIPGTETCLRLSGYYRYEIRYWPGTAADPVAGIPATEEGYYKYARFAPSFTAKSETEWGTLTGHATLYFNWTGQPPAVGYGTAVSLDHMYIELAGVRLGKGDSPYSRFLGYGTSNINDGAYGYQNTAELSYTYTGGNGFSAIIAAIEDQDDTDWAPDVEGGVNFVQGWGSAGAIFGYDESDGSWGGKFVVRVAPADLPVSGSLHVFYSGVNGTPGSYTILDPAGARTEWSVLGGVQVVFSPMLDVDLTAQWFDTGEWAFAGGLDIRPFANSRLRIRPEITYNTVGAGTTGGLIRFQSDY